MTINLRPYETQHAEELSVLIIRNLLEINIKDYTQEKMNSVAKDHTPDKINEMVKIRDTWLAFENDIIVGTVSLAHFGTKEQPDYYLSMMFVLPEKHGEGIGSTLLKKVEERAKSMSITNLKIPSGITAEGFYLKHGYKYFKGQRVIDTDGIILMQKTLS